MLLQRSTDMRLSLAVTLVLLLLAGCATTGPEKVTQESESADGEQVKPEIPSGTRILFEQAVAIMASGDFTEAELRFKNFVGLHPQYPGAYVNLAIIHMHNENNAAAEEAIDAALAADPDYPAALNQLGMLHRKNGKFLEAEAAYMKAVTVAPDYALAHYNLGVLNELYFQRLAEALQHFETYQTLVDEDKQVAKWITDLKRRVAAQRQSANTAE